MFLTPVSLQTIIRVSSKGKEQTSVVRIDIRSRKHNTKKANICFTFFRLFRGWKRMFFQWEILGFGCAISLVDNFHFFLISPWTGILFLIPWKIHFARGCWLVIGINLMFSRGLLLIPFAFEFLRGLEKQTHFERANTPTPQTNSNIQKIHSTSNERFHVSSPGVEFRVEYPSREKGKFSDRKMS